MKRFTDTEKWSDPWFRKLSLLHKTFWGYICDRCDNSGVWKPDLELAIFCIGQPLEEKELLTVFEGRIQVLDNGDWIIVKFIRFQFGDLNPACRPHQSILELLRKHKIGYAKGMVTLQDKTRQERTGQDQDQEGGSGGNFPDGGIPTLHEVTAYGETLNISAEVCKGFFDYHQGNNLWVNRNDRLIDWRHKMPGWNARELKLPPGRNGAQEAPNWKKIQLLEEAISKHRANPSSVFHSPQATELEKNDLRAKRAKLKALKEFEVANV